MRLSEVQLPLESADEKFPILATTLQKQQDESLFLGTLFSKSPLLKLKLSKDKLDEAVSLGLEKEFADDLVGVMGGARGTMTGDTAFATLHRGSSGVMGLFKKKKAFDNEEDFWIDVACNGDSYGFSYKHSIVQIIDGKIQVRRSREPGTVLDAAHIGDFIFGLNGYSLFREPYLNSEKRVTLRNDLGINYRFHKVEDGVFWLIGEDNKLMKVGLTDNKAMPTTKKLPDSPFRASADCDVDGWLYGIAANTMFRLRINPENRRDDYQEIFKWSEGTPESIVVYETEAKEGEARQASGIVSLSSNLGVQIFEFHTQKPEDAEEIPAAPELKKVWESADYVSVKNFCYLKDGKIAATATKKSQLTKPVLLLLSL